METTTRYEVPLTSFITHLLALPCLSLSGNDFFPFPSLVAAHVHGHETEQDAAFGGNTRETMQKIPHVPR